MDTNKKYHYVYRITNKVHNIHYYGKRSSCIPPKEDLGIKYFSSSTNNNFKEDQKSNPQNYKYKVILVFSTSEEAVALEVKLHNKFNVGINSSFYNKVKQTSTGFDTTGTSISEEHKHKITKALKGKNHTKKAIENMRKAQKGRIISEEHKEKIRVSNTNNKKVVKIANIYNYETKELIAEGVVIESWAKSNGYHAGHLRATAITKLKGYCGKTPRFKHKGIYAEYL